MKLLVLRKLRFFISGFGWSPLNFCLFGFSVNGSWSRWSSWSACSKTCYPGGITLRRRTCIPPKHGGKTCSGKKKLVRSCYTDSGPCPSKNNSLVPIHGYNLPIVHVTFFFPSFLLSIFYTSLCYTKGLLFKPDQFSFPQKNCRCLHCTTLLYSTVATEIFIDRFVIYTDLLHAVNFTS